MSQITTSSIQDFGAWLARRGLDRGYVVNLDNQVEISSPEIQEFADWIISSPDYENHEGIFFQYDKDTLSLFVAAIHRTCRGAGQGGTRFKQYHSSGELFTDAMRLAKGMTDKNSLAKIWWGGGKSVLHSEHNPKTVSGELRKQIFSNFGKFIASLNGLYSCAEDMNTTPEDMRVIHSNNRFCTCVPNEVGGSSNPSFFTARGVFKGLVAAAQFLDGNCHPEKIDLTDKHVIVQGAGNVGYSVIEQIIEHGGKVSFFDTYQPTIDKVVSNFPSVNVIKNADDIYDIEADIFSPNAVGAILNDNTIPRLKVKIVAGGANNQLKNPVKHATMLHQKGIIYVPDFLVNRMGIVNCADEQYGYLPDSIEKRLHEIHPDVVNLLELSQKDNISPQFKALELATKLSYEKHPIWGHRGKEIIHFLMKDAGSVWKPKKSESSVLA